MKNMRMRSLPRLAGRYCLFATSAIALLWMFLPGLHAEEPPVFAITNARVVTVTGPPIEKGTVVFRNGIIEAVGANIVIPGDARIIDATGLTLYPGLIDALSDIGLEETRAQAPMGSRTPGTPGQAPASQSQQSTQSPDERQGLTPYRQAIEVISAANRKIESARAAGITTALVSPRRGIFEGQSTLINLSGGDLGKMVVRNPVAFHITIASGFGFGRGYPSSLMGVIAFVKQTLMDARRYDTAWGIYNANPGAVRPEYDRALEALQPLIKQRSPLVLSGDTAVEIQRDLDLADAFKMNFILAGGAEAGKVAAALRERKVPVLLTVKYPERDREGDPEAREELNDLRRRVEAPSNAAALAKAGVRFAFQSGDIANPRDFIRNVGRAVEAGLDKETALRALTLVPAEIFGVADRLGSIEKSKTANLILTTGDLFNDNTRVKYVFVDGCRFEISESDAPRTAETGAPTGGSLSVTGMWTLNVNSPQGSANVTLNLRQEGSAVRGTVTSPMGTAEIADGSISGGMLTLKVSAGGIDATFTATIQGSTMTGTISAGQMGTMAFTGSRSPRD